MDAVKFIEERRRMYRVTGKHAPTLAEWIPAEDVVKEVEAWSAAHPHKTRQGVFLEQWPQASIGDDGVLKVCPCLISEPHRNAQGGCVNIHRQCHDCRKEFWGQEVE